MSQTAIEKYGDLLKTIETQFSGIQERHPEKFQCKRGCSTCCCAGLKISPIEAKAIKEYLTENRNPASKMTKQSSRDSCEFLSTEGACTIYEVRPLICRSHGAPMLASATAPSSVTMPMAPYICPLNFTGIDLTTLDSQDVINFDVATNTLRSINHEAMLTSQHDSNSPSERQSLPQTNTHHKSQALFNSESTRIPLTPAGILNSKF